MGINFKNSRIIGIISIVSIAVLVLFGRLVSVQLVNHEKFLTESKIKNVYTAKIPAARGEIVDRNGNPLVINRQGNDIILDGAVFPAAKQNNERNNVLINLIRLFDENGQEWENNLPLVDNGDGTVSFAPDSDSEIAKMKSKDMLNLANYATAANCYDALLDKYGIEGYSVSESLKIAALRYELTLQGFSVSTPVVVAKDVSEKVALVIKENSDQYYLGADIQVAPYREYTDGTIAPHLIGTTTKMTAELYAELKDDGYGLNDMVGESGIEKAMETYLRGTDGEMTVTMDENGNVTKEVTKEPVQGNTLVLTIDKDLQIIAQNYLAQVVQSVSTQSAGTVVAVDPGSGEIIAAASYPTFNLSTYREDYDELSKQSTLPLWNRYAQGTYAPGSTFKPAMAIAALETGTIDQNTTFRCAGTFLYKGHVFQCQHQIAHGTVNVEKALQESCNIFFYNCADAMGIQKMNEYATDLGLGQKTGVEIAEAKGILAGKSYTESIGGTWLPGFTLQAAIGQSDNLFTPLQLASYCSTVANGGTRYQLRFVKQVLSYDCTAVVNEVKPNILETLDVSQSTLDIVHNGMRRVVTNGAPSYAFKGTVVDVSAKTGTSQVTDTNGKIRNNGFLISYAPSDNPQIAIASVIEEAGSGTQTAVLTKEIINAYYSTQEYSSLMQPYSALLP